MRAALPSATILPGVLKSDTTALALGEASERTCNRPHLRIVLVRSRGVAPAAS